MWPGAPDLEVLGLTADSRAVRPGWLFAALPGAHHDGRAYIEDAIARGASAILAPPGTTTAIPTLTDPEPRRALARLAAAFAAPPPETLIAITGTNGKTSTAEFVRQLHAAAGNQAASLGTLGVIAPGHTEEGGLTTPDPIALAATLAALARAGVTTCALEASSHGLDQFRLDGLRFAAAAFTNLTRDHLDYHATLDAYRAAKLRLFTELLPRAAPALADAQLDPATLAALRDARPTLRTTGEGGDLFRLVRTIPRPDGQSIKLEAAGHRRTYELALPGRFQADNALLAAGLAWATGVPHPLDRLPRLTGVRGRMELAARLPNGAAAYVDYAHTPDAIARLIAALRPHTQGRLHLLFGAGGDRDRGKRPLMGGAALAADQIWITDDNPRTENPAAIRAAIRAACPGAREIGDRAACIAAALGALAQGDILAVAGKGHERGQTIAGTTYPFDDAAIVRELAG